MVWAKDGTVTDVTQQLTELSGYKFTNILNYVIDDGSAIDADLRIDGLSTSTYAYRESDNGSADVTNVSQAEITLDDTNAASPRFSVVFGFNLNTEEKLFIAFTCDTSTAGTASHPSRVETVGKQSGTNNLGS